jgi:hypothetical protein
MPAEILIGRYESMETHPGKQPLSFWQFSLAGIPVKNQVPVSSFPALLPEFCYGAIFVLQD